MIVILACESPNYLAANRHAKWPLPSAPIRLDNHFRAHLAQLRRLQRSDYLRTRRTDNVAKRGPFSVPTDMSVAPANLEGDGPTGTFWGALTSSDSGEKMVAPPG